MSRIKAMSAGVAIAIVVAMVPGAVPAHTGWSVSGSFLASGPDLGACVYVPTCAVQYLGDTPYDPESPVCQDSFAWNDTLMSFRRLPKDLDLHRAQLTWSSTAGPVDPVVAEGFVILHFFGDGEAARQFYLEGVCGYEITLRSYSPQSPTRVTIPEGATRVGVSASIAAQVTWKLTGIPE